MLIHNVKKRICDPKAPNIPLPRASPPLAPGGVVCSLRLTLRIAAQRTLSSWHLGVPDPTIPAHTLGREIGSPKLRRFYQASLSHCARPGAGCNGQDAAESQYAMCHSLLGFGRESSHSPIFQFPDWDLHFAF